MSRSIELLVTFSVGICVCLGASAQDWNQFRGPRADGTTSAVGLPTKFAEGSPEIAWKTAIAGRAWSSPVVWRPGLGHDGPRACRICQGTATS